MSEKLMGIRKTKKTKQKQLDDKVKTPCYLIAVVWKGVQEMMSAKVV